MSFIRLDPNGILWTPNYDGTVKLKFNVTKKSHGRVWSIYLQVKEVG